MSFYFEKDIRILIRSGALDTLDEEGNAPIHVLFERNGGTYLYQKKFEVLPVANDLLDRGADINLRNKRGLTALHLAAANRGQYYNTKDIHYLLNRGADLTIRDNEGNTALHVATENTKYCAHANILLLIERGADPEAQNDAGITPHWNLLKHSCDRPNRANLSQFLNTQKLVASQSRTLMDIQARLEQLQRSIDAPCNPQHVAASDGLTSCTTQSTDHPTGNTHIISTTEMHRD